MLKSANISAGVYWVNDANEFWSKVGSVGILTPNPMVVQDRC